MWRKNGIIFPESSHGGASSFGPAYVLSCCRKVWKRFGHRITCQIQGLADPPQKNRASAVNGIRPLLGSHISLRSQQNAKTVFVHSNLLTKGRHRWSFSTKGSIAIDYRTVLASNRRPYLDLLKLFYEDIMVSFC